MRLGAWLPARGIQAWALCCGCAWSWISLVGELMLTWGKGRVSSRLPDQLYVPLAAWAGIETGSSGKYVVIWITESSCKSSNVLPHFQCTAQPLQQMKQGLLRQQALSISTRISPKSGSSLCPERRRGDSLGLCNYRWYPVILLFVLVFAGPSWVPLLTSRVR